MAMRAGLERIRARFPFKTGVLTGLCAYLLGYSITYATTIARVKSALSKHQIDAKLSLLGIGGIQPWKVTGWFYYSIHFTDITTKGVIHIRTLNLISLSTSNPRVFLFGVPPVLLVIAGFITAHLANAEQVTVGAASGLTVVPGYFALAFAGAFLTQINLLVVVAGPNITTALITGLLYPLVFAPLGGALGALIRSAIAEKGGSQDGF